MCPARAHASVRCRCPCIAATAATAANSPGALRATLGGGRHDGDRAGVDTLAAELSPAALATLAALERGPLLEAQEKLRGVETQARAAMVLAAQAARERRKLAKKAAKKAKKKKKESGKEERRGHRADGTSDSGAA